MCLGINSIPSKHWSQRVLGERDVHPVDADNIVLRF